LEGGREPVKALVETITSGGAARLDVPLSVAQPMEAQLLSHLSGAHGVGEILLVGEHEEDRVPELILVEHTVQLVTSSVDTITIVGVDHEDQALGVLVIVSPEGSNLVLPPDIPHGKANILVFDSLDVEAYTTRLN
jgi:hypothetical protein